MRMRILISLKVRMRMLMRRFHLQYPRMRIPMRIIDADANTLSTDADANTLSISWSLGIKKLYTFQFFLL